MSTTIGFGYLFSLFFNWQSGGKEVSPDDERLYFDYKKHNFPGWFKWCRSNKDYDVKVSL